MKHTKILLVLVAIVGGLIALRTTGSGCSIVVWYTMENGLHNYGQSIETLLGEDLDNLHKSIIPSICSEQQFSDAKDAKWVEWNNRAIQQQEQKQQEQEQQNPTKKTGSDY